MEKIFITGPDTLDVDWTKEPVFEFVSEIDALETLALLGDDLKAAREQARQIMRYMSAAVIAARTVEEGGKKTTPQAIINHSGLARQTVYDMLGEPSTG